MTSDPYILANILYMNRIKTALRDYLLWSFYVIDEEVEGHMADLSKFTWLVGRSQYWTSFNQYAVWDPRVPLQKSEKLT